MNSSPNEGRELPELSFEEIQQLMEEARRRAKIFDNLEQDVVKIISADNRVCGYIHPLLGGIQDGESPQYEVLVGLDSDVIRGYRQSLGIFPSKERARYMLESHLMANGYSFE